VGPDEAQLVARPEPQVDRTEKATLRGVGLQGAGIDELLGAPVARAEVDGGGPALGVAELQLVQLRDQLAGAVDAGLLLCRAGLGPLAQPFDLSADGVAQRVFAPLLRGEQFLPLLEEAAVVAFAAEMAAGVAFVQLDDAVRDALQKAPVV